MFVEFTGAALTVPKNWKKEENIYFETSEKSVYLQLGSDDYWCVVDVAETADKRSSVERLADQEVGNLMIVDLSKVKKKFVEVELNVVEILQDDVVVELVHLETRMIL